MNAFLVAAGRRDERADAAAAADRSLRSQGFVERLRVDRERWVLVAYRFDGRHDDTSPDLHVRRGAADAFAVGVPLAGGSAGRAALEHLLARETWQRGLDPDVLDGSFAAAVADGEQLTAFTDPIGLGKLYLSSDGRLASTSWLAVLEGTRTRQLDRVAALQYVLHGAAHGERTPVRGIEALPSGTAIEWPGGLRRRWVQAAHWRRATPCASYEEARDRIAVHLRGTLAAHARAAGGRVRMALSGGFDSRLILAGLRSAGVAPDLFVYGEAQDPDVLVATHVASGEGLQLTVYDKSALDRGVGPIDATRLEEACLFFDGTPVDGIVDAGSDRSTRLAQHAGGAIVLNGGGGEVLRDFFRLPPGRHPAADLVDAFYSGFDAGAIRRDADRDALREAMTSSISASVGESGPFDRAAVDRAYALFRCRHWMGRNNAVSARWGLFATPLLDAESIRLAPALPWRWKAAGRLESAVIGALDARVAAYSSSYGHGFDREPPTSARVGAWLHRLRPIRLRPVIARVARRVRGGDPAARAMDTLRTALGGEWGCNDLVDPRMLPDATAVHRAATIEHLIRTRGIAP
jgi:asparagine synthase (glutamine-hydrolysing)